MPLTLNDYLIDAKIFVVLLDACRNYARAVKLLRSMGGTYDARIQVWTVVRVPDGAIYSSAQASLRMPAMYGLRIISTDERNDKARAYNVARRGGTI